MSIEINSEGGFVTLGDYGISWGNSQDPFFGTERLEGYFSINFGATSIELGSIDHEHPGLYVTRYKDGDIESTTTLLRF